MGAMKLINIRSRFGPAEIGTSITGDGPTVLLVAGLGGKGSFWNHQVRALSQHFRVVTHDHRGTGVSSRSRMVYSAEQMTEDLVALMDALGIERAHLVGHSTGGAIGQFMALNHPERLERLVISASWAGPTELFIETFRLRRQVLITQGPQAYYFLGSLLASPAEAMRSQFTSLHDHLVDRLADFPGLEIELSRIAAVMSHDLRSHLHQIRASTLVIGAEDDQLTPPGMQREVATLIPGARLQILPRGGHFYPVNSAEAFNRLVLGFLTESAAPAQATERRTGSMP
jgi:aminoacrylate hydrolase